MKILLVDDHKIVMDGIAAMLATFPEYKIVGKAENGKKAILFAKLHHPDLIIMDLDMPEMNGIVAAGILKKEMPKIKIIILSLHAEQSIIQQLIQIGVDGYLFKNSDQSEFIAALETMKNGRKYFSGEVTIALSKSISNSSMHSNSSLISLLTAREIEVVKGVAEGLSNKEIAQQLFVSHRTIDTHRQNIMKKLGINKVVGLIKFAIRNGLAD